MGRRGLAGSCGRLGGGGGESEQRVSCPSGGVSAKLRIEEEAGTDSQALIQ